MRSRIYTSRFYPQEIVHFSADFQRDLFADLERSNSDRVERDRIKAEQKESNMSVIISGNFDIQTNKIKRVVLLGIPSNNENEMQIRRLYKKKNRVRFRLFYENGEIRDVEATNSSYLYKYLIRQCRESKK